MTTSMSPLIAELDAIRTANLAVPRYLYRATTDLTWSRAEALASCNPHRGYLPEAQRCALVLRSVDLRHGELRSAQNTDCFLSTWDPDDPRVVRLGWMAPEHGSTYLGPVPAEVAERIEASSYSRSGVAFISLSATEAEALGMAQ